MHVWTIGHSTRSSDELRSALRAYEIELLVDVRRFPGSRRLPQFGHDALRDDLTSHGLAYCWIAALGGRRRPEPDSLNSGWRHPAFRAYADYIATEEFAEGLLELLMLANGLRTAIMCSEVLWCHRRLISDVLVSIGVSVTHIRDAKVSEEHKISAPGHLVDGELSYRA